MFHEVAHGLGIKNTVAGRGTVRDALKEQAGALEEGKADILGLYMITRLQQQGELPDANLDDNYVTFLASIFRSIRFGAASAHGRANAAELSFLQDHGAFTRDSASGRYRVDFPKMRAAIDSMAARDPALPRRWRLRGSHQLHGRARQAIAPSCRATSTGSAPRAFRWTSSSSRGPRPSRGRAVVAKPPKVVDMNRWEELAAAAVLRAAALPLAAAWWCVTSCSGPGSAVARGAGRRRPLHHRTGRRLAWITVDWRLVLPRGPELAESTRVEVGVNDGECAQVATVPADEHSDTLRVPAPRPGQTASGYSCVTPLTRGRLTRENCTPWQFVRPSAGPTKADSTPAGGPPKRPAARVSRIEVQPAGIQVDPDRNGRCATWQRVNPGRSVWVRVNQQAVPECTGANGKPTVAQFCAFAVLADGRRVRTAQRREGGILQGAVPAVDPRAHRLSRPSELDLGLGDQRSLSTPGRPIFRET